MVFEKCIKESFVVIGKEGSTNDRKDFIQKLWKDTNSNFNEVQHLAKKDDNIKILVIWVIMSVETENLTFMAYVPADCISEKHRRNWPSNTYILLEYCFSFECDNEITLSHEHTEYVWLPYSEVCKKLKWDSYRTAMYELKFRLEAGSC